MHIDGLLRQVARLSHMTELFLMLGGAYQGEEAVAKRW